MDAQMNKNLNILREIKKDNEIRLISLTDMLDIYFEVV
jgi:hypothetical protein